MCYKKPGPRCSKRARIKLQRAKARLDAMSTKPLVTDEQYLHAQMDYTDALRQYEMTPEGQAVLASEIKKEMDLIAMGEPREHAMFDLHKRLIMARSARMHSLQALKEARGKKPKDHHSATSTALFALYDDNFDQPKDATRDIIKEYTRRYGEPIGQGRTRVVYDRGDGSVVKVPLSWQGCRDNWQEDDWSVEETGIPLAGCHIEKTNGVPLLVMERVEPITSRDEMPEWASRVDCYQVGINSAGYAVAYDL